MNSEAIISTVSQCANNLKLESAFMVGCFALIEFGWTMHAVSKQGLVSLTKTFDSG